MKKIGNILEMIGCLMIFTTGALDVDAYVNTPFLLFLGVIIWLFSSIFIITLGQELQEIAKKRKKEVN